MVCVVIITGEISGKKASGRWDDDGRRLHEKEEISGRKKQVGDGTTTDEGLSLDEKKGGRRNESFF